jgi:hypothetical protein
MFDGKFYEVVSKPWFGPKKRAREHLAKRTIVQSPEEAYKTLSKLLGGKVDNIQEIRFYDYIDKKDGFHFTIGLIWTFCDYKFRDSIYDIAEKWVEASGWYPLPQGERIGSRLSLQSFFNDRKWEAKTPQFSGEIESISSAVDPHGGCSIGVKIGNEYLILDTGLRGSFSPQKLDKLCFVSHTHGDHAGNIDLLNRAKVPVVMSEATSYLLSRFKRISDRDLLENTIAVPSNGILKIGEGIELKAFPVPHMPGSVGAIVRDKNKVLIFSGDICFKTARHNYIDEFVQIVKEISADKKFVMLDATMAGRPFGASVAETAEAICSRDDIRDVVFSAPSADHLFYAYLDIFHHVKDGSNRNNVYFCLSEKLKAMFECVHESFITRKHNELDPFLLGQYHKTMSSWAESRWLFWIPSTPSFDSKKKRFYFVSDNDWSAVQIPKDAWQVRIGRDGGFQNIRNLDVDANPWSLHSDGASLVEVTRKLSEFSKVILFHNWEDKLNSFIKLNHLDAIPLSQRSIKLE